MGRSKITHFRHSVRNVGCPTYSNESAAHRITKDTLADALRSTSLRKLSVAGICECDGTPTLLDGVPWVETWDTVATELDVGGVSGDIVLLREGAPIAVIEVYGSSSVTAKKAERLNDLGLPWVEIPLGPNHDDEPSRRRRTRGTGLEWRLDLPLRARRTGPGPYGCKVCEAARAAAARSGIRSLVAAEPNPLLVAEHQANLLPLWERTLWQQVDGELHRLCVLQICDVTHDVHGVRRCLCLANHRHILAWSHDEDKEWDIDVARDRFKVALRHFMSTLHQLTEPRVERWEQVGQPTVLSSTRRAESGAIQSPANDDVIGSLHHAATRAVPGPAGAVANEATAASRSTAVTCR